MDLGHRYILWSGEPAFLLKVQAGPGQPRLLSLESCPKPSTLTTGDGSGDLGQWLAARTQPGSQVDVIYQHHMLQVETFPSLGAGDLSSALKARLVRDLLVSLDDLEYFTARIDGGGQTQGLFAAVLQVTHLAVIRALQTSGTKLGRVGFAGQLALRGLALQCPAGGWTAEPGLADGALLLMAVDATGLVMEKSLGSPAEGTPEACVQKVKLFLPKLNPSPEPDPLGSKPLPGARPLGGTPLPAPLSFVLPIFLSQPDWRKASQADVDYPYILSLPAWAFSGVVAALLIYTAILGFHLWDIHSVQADVARLETEKKALSIKKRQYEDRQASLLYLQKHVRGVGAEVFDNGGWLGFLSVVRDRTAPSVLFEVVAFESGNVTLSGSHDSASPVLAFASGLSKSLGEDSAHLVSLSADDKGRIRFNILVRRDYSLPPQLPDDQG